ncbi:MAG: STAS domain-containing protein [Kiritimatiellae bacterium]|nr:STAS domain-containing protein [Kiritimatiellia bacterium]MDD4735128.1 STAS domain-containing protein [Kiritimatiellia bacterium]
MTLQVHIAHRKNGACSVTLSGRLDHDTAKTCENQLAPILKEKVSGVLFNLAALDYISSAGVRLVLKVKKQVVASGGKFAVLHMQPPVAKVMEMAEVLVKTEVFDSEQVADIYLDAMQRSEAMKHADMPDE